MDTDIREHASPFFFVGGALALDLANTEITARGRRRDLLASSADLDTWLGEAATHYPELIHAAHGVSGDDGALRAVTGLRGRIRALFEAVAAGNTPDPATIAAINDVLRRGEHVVEPEDVGGYRSVFRARSGGVDDVLVPVAWSAGELLTGTDPGRIHECANERCILLFHDTTKSGTRRWCSTGCMNRARSIARYREQKGRKQAD